MHVSLCKVIVTGDQGIVAYKHKVEGPKPNVVLLDLTHNHFVPIS